MISRKFSLFHKVFLFALIMLAAGCKTAPAGSSVVCPNGHSGKNVVPIVYGYPGPGLMEKYEKGEVMLGGCIVTGKDPKWYCRICETRW